MPDPTALTMAQAMGKSGPALSATSDMPVATPAPPAPAAAPAPADAPSPAPAPAASGADTPPAGDDKTGSGDSTPAWMKAEITKERNRRRDAEQRAADLQRKFEELALRQAPPAPPAPAEAPAPAAPPRPKRADFDDPDAYDAAVDSWHTERATLAARSEVQRAADEDRQRQVQAEQTQRASAAQKAWTERRDKFIEATPDYVEVAENPEVRISQAMAAAIVTADNGPQVAYHLGKHPAEAARIAALQPLDAQVEIRILARDLAKRPPELTKAPDPVTTVGARANAGQKSADEESMEEYAARRNRELKSAVR